MKLWLDDVRPAPEGWMWAKDMGTACAIVRAFQTAGEPIEEMSLDHDLGEDDEGELLPTGYDFVLWMAEHGLWPEERPVVHSSNPVGRHRMQGVIDRYFGDTSHLEAV